MAQSQVELLQSEYLEGYKDSLGEVKQKILRCTFRHANTLLIADSSYLYPQKNNFDAFGHIHIKQGDSLNIYAEYLHYDGNTKMAYLERNVRLINNDAILTTNFLTYNLLTKVATYHNGGKLTHRDNVLTSETGYYHVKTRDAYFKNRTEINSPDTKIKSDTLRYNTLSKIVWFYGPSRIFGKDDVLYTEDGQYNTITQQAHFGRKNEYRQGSKVLLGDSLFYDRKLGYGKAKKNIIFVDTLNKAILKGNLATYYRHGSRLRISQKPYCVFEIDKNKQTKDSLWFSADTISSYEVRQIKKEPKDSLIYRVIYAHRNTRTFKNDLQAVADSLSFSYQDSVLRFFKNPLIWAQGSQMSADTILITIKDKKLYELFLLHKSFLTNLNEDSLSFNQIGGRKMNGYFVDNKLQSMYVNGNAESIYAAKDGVRNIGINRSVSSGMRLGFADNKLQEVVFIRKPEMRFIPTKDIQPEEKVLKNFIWKPNSRPKSKLDIILGSDSIVLLDKARKVAVPIKKTFKKKSKRK